MTASAFFTFVYGWVNLVINTSHVPVRTIPIIQSHQAAPAPTTGAYLVIQYAPSRTFIGRASSGDVKNTGVQQSIQDMTCGFEVREVNGVGDYLEELAVSIEKQSIRDLFWTNKIAYLSSGSVQVLPFLEESEWTKEAVLEFQFGVAVEILESPSWIEIVKYSGAIPASGRAGTHTITNIIPD